MDGKRDRQLNRQKAMDGCKNRQMDRRETGRRLWMDVQTFGWPDRQTEVYGWMDRQRDKQTKIQMMLVNNTFENRYDTAQPQLVLL